MERVSFGVLTSYSYFYYSYYHKHDDCILFNNLYSNEKFETKRFDSFVNYRSTGMAAGNSFKDAFVRASWEVFERVIEYKVFTQEIKPTCYELMSIPNSKTICELFPSLFNDVFNENNKIYVIDSFSETCIPVVGILILDMNLNKYVFRFAAHPIFEVAMEKALVEIFQMQDYHGVFKYLGVDFEDDDNSAENIIELITNGRGRFPINKILRTNNYKSLCIEKYFWPNNNKYSIDRLYEYCISIYSRLNWMPFFRKKDFINACCVQVIVPNVSCLYNSMMNYEMKKRKISELCVLYIENKIEEKNFEIGIIQLLIELYKKDDYDFYRRTGIHNSSENLRKFYREVYNIIKNNQISSVEAVVLELSVLLGKKFLVDNFVPFGKNTGFKEAFEVEKNIFDNFEKLNLD